MQIAVMAQYKSERNYYLCPHTASGVYVMEYIPMKNLFLICHRSLKQQGLTGPFICLATAHPAKFDESVYESATIVPSVPSQLRGCLRDLSSLWMNIGILSLPRKCERITDSLDGLKAFVDRKLAEKFVQEITMESSKDQTSPLIPALTFILGVGITVMLSAMCRKWLVWWFHGFIKWYTY